MPSLTEGLPIVLLEAMQAGVPIVASKVGGIPNVLDNGMAGLLIEPGNIASLKQGLSEVICRPGTAGERVQAARLRVREVFSCKTMSRKYHEIYERVVLKSLQLHASRQTQRTR